MENQNTTQPNTGYRGGGNRGGDRGGDRRGPRKPKEQPDFDSVVLDIARVTRVTRGGKRFSFRATVAAGNGKGKVGVGVGKGIDVQQAIQKGTNKAKKNMIQIVMANGTIPHDVNNKYNSAMIMLKPAIVGRGVKAGGSVRVIVKLAGIENIVGKILSRTNNKINIARATVGALKKLKIKTERTITS